MDRARNARNVAIVIAIAAAVAFLPGGGRGANTVASALWVGFAVGFGYVGLRVYRERRMWLLALGDRHRGLLYGAAGLAVFEWAGRSRLWETSLGELVWWVLAALTAYALLEVYRHSRAY